MARESKVQPSSSDLARRATKALELIAQIRALFPEAHALPADDRRNSRGKFGAEESKGYRGVLDAIDLHPQPYAVLADEDDGHDPNRLETDLLRARLDEHDHYLQLSEAVGELVTLITDAALVAGEGVRPVLLAAYEIAKPIAKRDPATREKIKVLLDYYGANAAASAATRKAKHSA